MLKAKRSLPPGRSLEQVRNHYLVEKAIATRLKQSRLEKRKLIYSTMYQELFEKVPDHPRLTRRESQRLSDAANRAKLSLVGAYLDESSVFVEFAPGDCRFAREVAGRVRSACGIDISDQRNPKDVFPENFRLIVYDGYGLDEIENDSVDVVFSNHLIEHLHPEDVKLHFALVRRMLKPGGKYVFRTPHALSGPHDVSRYFSDEPECFHLKEWTYGEIKKLLEELRFSRCQARWRAKEINLRMPYGCLRACERVIGLIPRGRCRRLVALPLIPSLYAVAVK